ncbi:metallophosphoesterase [Flavivirga sp. 57AJ16]|uniref:metallophosphoesterase n=1 Tax=Flavivirga sp. 57AJ16 TaxID=3025307 RepID=UPI002366AA55|nr:metallophosphoesterase [Flavivirga sp. 57AJ16]MDD7886958.1 metallophosphoesterase [Flavivirga sp. 57AJ16]
MLYYNQGLNSLNVSYFWCLILLTSFTSIVAQESLNDSLNKDVQIAFIADIHFQDIYGSFSDNNYKGVFNESTKKFTLLRTMDSQLHSTRIFNENYFALFAALDDMVAKGIKYVALPGDYSDDGQAIHLRGLEKILKTYSTNYGMQFFITTGNHDPVGPFDQESGKSDFMGTNGQTQRIYSNVDRNTNGIKELPDVITQDIKKLGYQGIFGHLKSFGFFPQKNYLYWATPFSNYSPESYTFQKGLEHANLDKRMYDVIPNHSIPDASYVVEPLPGVWLLAIDANVYIPKNTENGNLINPIRYEGTSIGYNNVLTHKTHLIKWIKKVANEAKKHNKTLIAFSHYPIVDFNDNASENLKAFFGGNKWQLERVPDEMVSKLLSDAGITIHIAGHMHINDTGIRSFSENKSIVNIQTPSIAAYIPGYKILNIKSGNKIEVNTITINTVPNFNELFPLYEKEFNYLKQSGKPLWNFDILRSKSYHDFTMFHLRELVRLRFLEDDWIPSFKDFMLKITGEELLILPYLDSKIGYETLISNKNSFKDEWKLAKNKAKKELEKTDFKLNDFKDWDGFDLIFDFYRLRNADILAIKDIGLKRIEIYKWLFTNQKVNKRNYDDLNEKKLLEFYNIFAHFLNGAPTENFSIDYKTGNIFNY